MFTCESKCCNIRPVGPEGRVSDMYDRDVDDRKTPPEKGRPGSINRYPNSAIPGSSFAAQSSIIF